jgi:hypothetical protein
MPPSRAVSVEQASVVQMYYYYYWLIARTHLQQARGDAAVQGGERGAGQRAADERAPGGALVPEARGLFQGEEDPADGRPEGSGQPRGRAAAQEVAPVVVVVEGVEQGAVAPVRNQIIIIIIIIISMLMAVK